MHEHAIGTIIQYFPHRIGKLLYINHNDGTILNNNENSKLWKREYEKDWELKV